MASRGKLSQRQIGHHPTCTIPGKIAKQLPFPFVVMGHVINGRERTVVEHGLGGPIEERAGNLGVGTSQHKNMARASRINNVVLAT